VITPLRTLGKLKQALKTARAVYVWCNWQGDEGDYIAVSKIGFLRSIGADTPNDGAHGGRGDWTPVRAELRGDQIYID
jgi:hypothetical protein